MVRSFRKLGVLLLLLTLAGCRPAPPGPDGGTAIVGLAAEPASLNPILGQGEIDITGLLFSGLFRVTGAGPYEPDLASEIPTAANGGIVTDAAGMTVTYRLRPGVLWHDGTLLTAEDIKFTYEAIKKSGREALRAQHAAVKAVDVVDPQTVRVRLEGAPADPLSLFPRVLPAQRLQASADLAADPFNRNPVGTGPFKLREWTPRDRIVLAANESYYGPHPRLDGVIFRVVPDPVDRFYGIKTGHLDLYPGITLAQAKALDPVYGVTIRTLPDRQTVGLSLNADHPLLRDGQVGQAVRAALDRSQLVAAVFGGFATAAADDRPPAGTEAAPPRAAAEALLTAAGWVRGEDGIFTRNGVRLAVPCVYDASDPAQAEVATALQAQLKEAGVEFRPAALDGAAFAAAVRARGYATALIRYELPPGGDTIALYRPGRLDAVAARLQGYQPGGGERLGKVTDWWIKAEVKP